MKVATVIADKEYIPDIRSQREADKFIVTTNGTEHQIEIIELKPDSITLMIDNWVGFFEIHRDSDGRIEEIITENRCYGAQASSPQQRELVKVLSQFAKASGGSISGNLKAPMPGKILGVKVKEGDRISFGQVVLILEAMKMENEITTNLDGIVTKVMVEKGSIVTLGQTLIEVQPANS